MPVIPIFDTLAAAQATGCIKREMARLLKPSLLIVDELGYLPIDKFGADALFQVISQRYERGSTVITTNRAFKSWPEIFNNDSTLTSALLDRLLHHAESSSSTPAATACAINPTPDQTDPSSASAGFLHRRAGGFARPSPAPKTHCHPIGIQFQLVRFAPVSRRRGHSCVVAHNKQTFSPLSNVLTDRSHPELLYLRARRTVGDVATALRVEHHC